MWLFVKNLVFVLLFPATVAAYLPFWLARGAPGGPIWARVLAVPAFAAGVTLFIRCVVDFAVVGRGTPVPIDAPRVLVVTGPYRYVRNPMYLGILLVLVGWTLWTSAPAFLWYLPVVAVGFHLFVVLVEEPLLTRKFGAGYLDYRQATRRWVPRRTPYRPA
jgi:protein-S-isoprenylcysteine O-methyltransferase Ste14